MPMKQTQLGEDQVDLKSTLFDVQGHDRTIKSNINLKHTGVIRIGAKSIIVCKPFNTKTKSFTVKVFQQFIYNIESCQLYYTHQPKH